MNATPLANVLDLVVQPYVSPALIAPDNFTAIQTIARHLPSTLTTFFGFECRLGATAAPTDFLLSVTPPTGRDVLAGQGAALPTSWLQHPVWQHLGTFARRWADPDAVLHRAVNNVWLEFDLADSPTDLPVPSVFFGPQPLRAHAPHAWVGATAIPLLRGIPLPAAMVRRFEHCCAALPGEAYVFQIGLMLARQVDVVRVCVRNLPAAHLGAYLQRIGWDGAAAGLSSLVATLAPLVDRIDLDLDVGETIFPKLGLECYFQLGPDWREKLSHFLDYLVDQEWCCATKRDALLVYNGYVQERADVARWPHHLLHASQLLGPGMVSMFLRFVHHVKVVYHPDGYGEAKAYLAVGHRWCPRATLRQLQQHAVPMAV
jgi:hypothetical protein